MSIRGRRPAALLLALSALFATSGCTPLRPSGCGSGAITLTCVGSLPEGCTPETTTIAWSNVGYRVEVVHSYHQLVEHFPEQRVHPPDQDSVHMESLRTGLDWLRMDHDTWNPVLATSLGEHIGVPVRLETPPDTAREAGRKLPYDASVPAYVTFDAVKMVTADFKLSCGDHSEGAFAGWTESRSATYACGSGPFPDDYVAEAARWHCPDLTSPTPTWTSMPGKKKGASSGTTPSSPPPG